MEIQSFCSQHNQIIFGILILLLEIISISLGWITFAHQSIITSPFCTYYMIGNTQCPLFFNGFNTHRISYKQCYQFDTDCKQANLIRDFFIAEQSLTHSQFILFPLFLCVIRMRDCIKIVWIIALTTSTILCCCNAIIIELFANESKNLVNKIIKNYIWGLFAVRLLQDICFFFSQKSIPLPLRDIIPPPDVDGAQVYPIIIDNEEYFGQQTQYDPIDEDVQIR